MTTAGGMMTCYRHPNRETGLSCSECGRPICTDCMTIAPVGIRCPDHSGKPRGAAGAVHSLRRLGYEGTGALATKALIAANVLVFLVELAQGPSIDSPGGALFQRGALYGSAVAHGDWWRLITYAFLHASLLHIGMNMIVLAWVGGAMEAALGRARFLLLYFVSALAGAAGALLLTPTAATVGASGAIYGIFGAGIVLERQRNYVFGGSALTLVVINLALSYAIPNVSIGGHLGGLVGGALGTLALSRFGRGHAAYSRPGAVGVATVVLVGVASVAVAYWRARGYT
jgi:membrane associated rhomboid family serine protease